MLYTRTQYIHVFLVKAYIYNPLYIHVYTYIQYTLLVGWIVDESHWGHTQGSERAGTRQSEITVAQGAQARLAFLE